MEDSSTNPYIPQESDQVRQKVYEHQSPLGRIVKWSMIATAIVAFLVGVGLFFVIPRTTAVDQEARVKLADTLQPPEQVLKRVSVESQLGFKLNYDNRVYSSYAEVGDSTAGTDESAAIMQGQTYENNDLRVARAYNYVRIRPIESVESSRALAPLPPELEVFATMTNEELEKALLVPENKGMSKLGLFVKIDTDKRLAKRVTDDKKIVTIDATKPVNTTIANVEYQKVRYTTTNDNHRISNVKYDDCYYTIQNDQPYSICVSDVRPQSVSAASLVEQVFDSITYEQPVTTTATTEEEKQKSSYVLPLMRFAQATNGVTTQNGTEAQEQDPVVESESPLITITPSYYGDADSLKSIASSQPSVVRIGTLYCADLALKFESGETATNLTDACVGNVASGVFISRDGYIATTGHAIRTQKKAAISGYINFAPNQDAMLDRLQRILDYLLKAKIILQSDADYIKTGASIGDQEALAKVQNIASVIPDKFITPLKEEYTYAIQPTDKPIVINRNDTYKPSFAYSDSVLSAKYVASDYEPTKAIQEVFGSATPKVDIGVLKVDGQFPDVPVAETESMKANDTLNTIGYTAYTDSSLTIDKIRNVPVATVSKVEQAYQKEGTRLIQTNTPVLPGNDGAPVIDNNGQLVGFAVYGLSYCPDQLCFGNGTVRSTSELWKLLDDNNIKLNTGSEMTATWRHGVSEYFRANYATSTSDFSKAGSQYAFNRWASPLQKLSGSLQGSTHDTSLMNQLQIVMIITTISLVVITLLLAVVFWLHRRRMDMLRVGHYGQQNVPMESAVSTTVLTPAPPLPPVQTLPPVQPQAPSQPPTPINSSPVIPIHGPHNPTSESTPPPSAPLESPKPPEQPLSGAVPPTEDPFYK